MCGIAGIVSPDPAPEPETLGRMSAAMVHRGPDDGGILIHGPVGFAHRRLSIVGLGKSGHQPMVHPEGRWSICYNGEIFNHLELRNRFPGHPWRGTSDTETLLHAIATMGWRILPDLNGFFAFAAHDRATGHVYLVRDRFGVKPLMWARLGNGWCFASEMGAMIAGGVRRRLNAPVLHRHLVNFWVYGPETCLDGVEMVMPGEMLVLDPDGTTAARHIWGRLSDSMDSALREELAGLTHEERLERLERTMLESVERRMLTEVPAATLCSGGIDSSLVTAMLARLHPEVEAFTMHHVEQPAWDESHYAAMVVERPGVTLHRVPMSADTWRKSFVKTACSLGAPIWYESAVAGMELAAAVAANGRKVLLGGEGADELCGGYDYKHMTARTAFFNEIGKEAPLDTYDEECWPMDVELWRVLGHAAPVATEETHLAMLRADLLAATAHLPPARGELIRSAALECRTHLYRALRQLDAWSMAHGVEAREPFLDLEMVRFCLNYPLEGHLWPTIKGDLKEVARRWLPSEVVDRSRKLGFSFDSNPFFGAHARPEFLADSMLREQFKVAKPRLLTKWLEPGRGRGAFRLISTEIWMRHYLDGQPISAIEAALWR
jgi:asparagine synthase (glutamine-hydrolysing)